MPEPEDPAVDLLRSPLDLRLDGRAVWITGASRGLGRALAFAFAGAGAELLLTARSEDALQEVVGQVQDAGGRALALAGSVSDPDHLSAVAERAASTWGRLDVLVNNAGISPVFARAEKVDPEQFEQTLSTNVTGALRCCQAALPLLTESDANPSVVSISSVHSDSAYERLIAYASSKAGLELMSRTLALEWAARGIRVNCVAPGYIETDMTAGLQASEHHHQALVDRIPLGRFARVAEIVGAVLFCASDAARYMTGASLAIDGGWSAH